MSFSTRRGLGLVIAALAAVLCFGQLSQAAVTLSGASWTYSENFDGKLTMTTANSSISTFSGTVGTQLAIPGTSGWDGVKAGPTSTGTQMPYVTSDGTASTGAIYNYGTTGTADRALGSLGSGTNAPAFGVAILNGNATPIGNVKITYTGEFWRRSTSVQNTLTFAYAVGTSTLSTTYLTAAATAFSALDLVGPAAGTNVALDGNASGNRTTFTATINLGLANLWMPNSYLYLRWTDVDNTGSDAGLAVDDFSILGTPEPTTFAVFGLGSVAVVLGRKRIRSLVR